MMRFADGATGFATAGSAAKQGSRAPHVLCIQGDEGTITTENHLLRGKEKYVGYLYRNGKRTRIRTKYEDNGHGDFTRCQNFLDAVQNGAPLIAPMSDAIRTSELLHAIWDSESHGICVPVHVSGKTG